MKKLLISALEPSSNLHLEPILENLHEYKISGIFDTKFGSPIYSLKDFSVMGIIDVIPKIRLAKRAIKEMVKLSKDCESALLIDAPAFNLPLARALKKSNPNIKIIYYILPKVWAWKKSRVAKIEKYCDEICSIFPFENQFYNKSKYVGNPLLDEIKTYKTTIHEKDETIAFLPGSRKSEIKALMPIFRELQKELEIKSILVIPPHYLDEDIKNLYGDISKFTVIKSTKDALLKSDFAFICSGTASLEAAITGTPSLIVYKARKIDYFIGRLFVKLQYVGLANIIFDFEHKEPMQKEFLQKDVKKENLLQEYKTCDKNIFLEKSKKLRDILQKGSAKEMSAIIKG